MSALVYVCEYIYGILKMENILSRVQISQDKLREG